MAGKQQSGDTTFGFLSAQTPHRPRAPSEVCLPTVTHGTQRTGLLTAASPQLLFTVPHTCPWSGLKGMGNVVPEKAGWLVTLPFKKPFPFLSG